VNVEDFQQLIIRHMETAKEALAMGVRIRKSVEIMQTAIVILPDGREHELPLVIPAGCDPRVWLKTFSTAIQELNPAALIVRAAGIRLNSVLLSNEVNLSTKNRTTRMENIFKWLGPKLVNGRIDSLPAKYFRHCLLVAGLGPRLPALGMMQEYTSKDGVLPFVGEQALGEGYEFPFLRKWWH
jgi:hypothetical protein